MSRRSVQAATALLGLCLGGALAAPVTVSFSEYAFAGDTRVPDDPALAFYRQRFGLELDSLYLYRDGRDLFDGLGVSGLLRGQMVSDDRTPVVGTIRFVDPTDFVTVQYWSIHPALYSAWSSSGALVGLFRTGPDEQGTATFRAAALQTISSLSFESLGSFSAVSGLGYSFDGVAGGGNVDLPRAAVVPEPGALALGLWACWALWATGRPQRRRVLSLEPAPCPGSSTHEGPARP